MASQFRLAADSTTRRIPAHAAWNALLERQDHATESPCSPHHYDLWSRGDTPDWTTPPIWRSAPVNAVDGGRPLISRAVLSVV